jgi:hypothetical protein
MEGVENRVMRVSGPNSANVTGGWKELDICTIHHMSFRLKLKT